MLNFTEALIPTHVHMMFRQAWLPWAPLPLWPLVQGSFEGRRAQGGWTWAGGCVQPPVPWSIWCPVIARQVAKQYGEE